MRNAGVLWFDANEYTTACTHTHTYTHTHTHTCTHVYTRTCAPHPSNATQNEFTENTALNKRDPKKANVFPLDRPVDRRQVATVKSSLKAALDEQVQRKENTKKFAKSIERAEDRYVD